MIADFLYDYNLNNRPFRLFGRAHFMQLSVHLQESPSPVVGNGFIRSEIGMHKCIPYTQRSVVFVSEISVKCFLCCNLLTIVVN